jgi:preprotein translocase subunit SecB
MTDTSRRSTAESARVPVQRIYLKDASLEMPNAPGIFLESENPKVDVQLEVSDSSVIEALHEVVVRVTVTAKVKDKVLLVEGKPGWHLRDPQRAGRAKAGGDRHRLPGIVYPYLRAKSPI